ncbi:hypothetical protein ADUPG1_004961 [Aduncisulcus paluster]|uniref:Uncharacterized protein n=2 Tax=Aduncisulcus paluster TaxID=2918883 RepID=A0ABQ5K7F1_9EUKA|nr:hypothetical protein ADUPG1_004961 [Aduncisulcus paluster]
MPATTSSTTSSSESTVAHVDIPCLKSYSMENLNDFFLRYDAYKSNPKVSNPSPWHRLIDPALLSSLKDILGFDSISTSEELKSLKRPFILWMGQRLRLTFIWHCLV